MWTDVVDLRDFYASYLGQTARRMIRRTIRAAWPDVSGMRVLGIGYAAPYLGQFRAEAERTIALMPAGQGVLHWPSEGGSATALAHEAELPFPDVAFDRVLLIHALESTEYLRPMLREAWRVLAGGGRLLVVVPNRRGLWARLERTPFANGRPYSPAQLSRLLRENLFTPIDTRMALFVPPFSWPMVVRTAPAWEKAGSRWFPQVGGVVVIEASKQLYAGTPLKVERRRFGRLVPNGIGSPTGQVRGGPVSRSG